MRPESSGGVCGSWEEGTAGDGTPFRGPERRGCGRPLRAGGLRHRLSPVPRGRGKSVR